MRTADKKRIDGYIDDLSTLLDGLGWMHPEHPDGEPVYFAQERAQYRDQLALLERRARISQRPLRVLDLGCYPGHLALLLRHQYRCEVSGAGITTNQLFLRRLKHFGIPFSNIDFERQPLPFGNDSFDAVLFTEVIEHLLNPFPIGRELARVLRPGGIVLLSTPNHASLQSRLALAQGKVTNPEYFLLADRHAIGSNAENDYPAHVRLWMPAEVHLFMEKLGLAIVEEQYGEFPVRAAPTLKEQVMRAVASLAPQRFKDTYTAIALKPPASPGREQ